jgi:hypothetical protein
LTSTHEAAPPGAAGFGDSFELESQFLDQYAHARDRKPENSADNSPEVRHMIFAKRIGQVKADQKARGRYLGGKVPFGFRRGDNGELVPHEAEQEAIREMVALRAQGKALRAIAAVAQAKGHRISHEGVAGVLRGAVN